MLRFSTNNDTPILKDIYNTCFPGESDFCDRYFEIVLPKNRCVVYDDGGIKGMVHLIDVEIINNGVFYKGAYLYAVATLPEYRGRGIAASILEYIENYCKSAGYDLLCLIPQKPSLFEFYSKLGLDAGLYISKLSFDTYKDTVNISISSNNDYEQMLEIYNNCECCKIKRTAETFKSIELVYNAKFNCLTDGNAVAAYCIGESDGETYEIYEAAGRPDDIKRLTNALAVKNGCKSIEITAPCDLYNNAVYGCTKTLSDIAATAFKNKKIYANLLFN